LLVSAEIPTTLPLLVKVSEEVDYPLFHEAYRLVAVNLHLMSEKPRFKRAIMQSGQARLIGPKTIEFHEKFYSMCLETLKLDKLTKSERVEELRTMSLDKLVNCPPPESMYQPCVDGVLYKSVPYWDDLADPKNLFDKPDWCESVMFGECKDDVSRIFTLTLIAGYRRPAFRLQS
jgi:hypothetical protein